MGQVHESAFTSSASSQELAESAEETTRAVQQVSSAIEEISVGADTQVEHVDDLQSAIESSEALISGIAQNAELVNTSAGRASRLAETGSEVLRKSIEQMLYINQTMDRISIAVESLGRNSDEIGRVVDTLRGIAEQINLLALNASIEAARAGEQGRGFAVVANEVRKLAEQSKEMVEKISCSIGVVQEEIKNAVDSASEGTEVVESGIKIANEAGESFEGILAAVEQVAIEIGSVSQSLRKLAETNALSVGVSAILQIASANAESTTNVSAATQEQMATMEDVSASASALSELAEQLQSLLSKFRV